MPHATVTLPAGTHILDGEQAPFTSRGADAPAPRKKEVAVMTDYSQDRQARRKDAEVRAIEQADDWLTKWIDRRGMVSVRNMRREDIVRALAEYGAIWQSWGPKWTE
jgi:hypothetical protein